MLNTPSKIATSGINTSDAAIFAPYDHTVCHKRFIDVSPLASVNKTTSGCIVTGVAMETSKNLRRVRCFFS